MSPLRRVLVVLGLLLLLCSLLFLVVANLPNEHLQDRQPIAPDDLTLPTPAAHLDDTGCLPNAPCRARPAVT